MARHAVIVVGVDGSARAQEALRFAVAEAARSGDQVEVLTAWTASEPQQTPATAESLAAERQEHAVQTALAGGTTVTVTRSLERGAAGDLLIRAARTARMLVLGGRGTGDGAVVLGDVGRYCAEHASCPVVIVPDGATGDPVVAGAQRAGQVSGAQLV